MALDSAIGVILRRSSATGDKLYLFSSNRDEIDQYLQAVDQIQSFIDSETAYDLTEAKSAIQIAMATLVDEMRHLLNTNTKSTRNNPGSSTYSSSMTDSGSNSYVDEYEYECDTTLSFIVINDVKSIVNRMHTAGFILECRKVYVSDRKRCVDASYRKLDVQKLSSNDARTMKWNELEMVIKVWMKSAKICFRKIFAYEKQLCEKVFGDLGEGIGIDDDCFLEICKDYAIQLLEIANNVSCISIASERLFGILDIYKTCFDLLPVMNEVFNTYSSESVRTKADQIVLKLADAACLIIEKFEKDLLTADMSQHVSVDKIHSLCKYVTEYAFKLVQNKQILAQLSLYKPPLESDIEMNFTNVESHVQNELSFHVMWIVMCLVFRLEGEAKLNKNTSDANFYLMNNFFYIVKKINEKPEVKEMIGDDCVEKVSSKFDQAKAEYLQLTLAKVLSILGNKKPSQKRLEGFNAEFMKLQSNMEKLKVPDFQLLKDIRVSMEEMLVPAYSSFLEQLSTPPCLTVDVKLSVEDLKSAIQGFATST